MSPRSGLFFLDLACDALSLWGAIRFSGLGSGRQAWVGDSLIVFLSSGSAASEKWCDSPDHRPETASALGMEPEVYGRHLIPYPVVFQKCGQAIRSRGDPPAGQSHPLSAGQCPGQHSNCPERGGHKDPLDWCLTWAPPQLSPSLGTPWRL